MPQNVSATQRGSAHLTGQITQAKLIAIIADGHVTIWPLANGHCRSCHRYDRGWHRYVQSARCHVEVPQRSAVFIVPVAGRQPQSVDCGAAKIEAPGPRLALLYGSRCEYS
jgi:hypothetical protein